MKSTVAIIIILLLVLPLVSAGYQNLPPELQNITLANEQIILDDPDDGLFFFSNLSRELYYQEDSGYEIDRFSRVTSYHFGNESFSIYIESDLTMPVKLSTPFNGKVRRLTLKKGMNHFVIPLKPYYGLYLAGIHTSQGDLFLNHRGGSLSPPDYPMVIAYSDLYNQMWKYAFISLFVAGIGFFITRWLLSISRFNIKSPITLLLVLLFIITFSIVLGYNVHDDVFVQIVEEQGVTQVLKYPVVVYDYVMGNEWREFLRYLYIVPFLIGFFLARNVALFNPLRILIFKGSRVEYRELLQSERGFAKDLNFDTVVFEFTSDDVERVEIPPYGEAILATDYEKESFGTPVLTNLKWIFGWIVFELVLAVISPKYMGIIVHPYYYILGGVLFAVLLNFNYVLHKLGLLPSHRVIITCSPVVNADSVSKSVMAGSVEAVVDGYKGLAKSYIEEKITAPYRLIDMLFGANKNLSDKPVKKDVKLDNGDDDLVSEEEYNEFLEQVAELEKELGGD